MLVRTNTAKLDDIDSERAAWAKEEAELEKQIRRLRAAAKKNEKERVEMQAILTELEDIAACSKAEQKSLEDEKERFEMRIKITQLTAVVEMFETETWFMKSKLGTLQDELARAKMQEKKYYLWHDDFNDKQAKTKEIARLETELDTYRKIKQLYLEQAVQQFDNHQCAFPLLFTG
ncbi:hypothetical protein K458DRAFT_386922 [Lentithecium fluviatile CBS 122367]|uniref:Uncharacterized protein n=1 Tax=Lentithecium fluviatile CBS 122367 TaxID=1168545 RepID=A0A6G1J966_9PLEO|nr:hypothetical protein K458DRAFT_386922 [Lentithecium fluviatile CBS 122367]